MNDVALVLADSKTGYPSLVMIVEAVINHLPVKRWAVKTLVEPVDEDQRLDNFQFSLMAHVSDALYQVDQLNEEAIADGFNPIWPDGCEKSCYLLRFEDHNIIEL